MGIMKVPKGVLEGLMQAQDEINELRGKGEYTEAVGLTQRYANRLTNWGYLTQARKFREKNIKHIIDEGYTTWVDKVPGCGG